MIKPAATKRESGGEPHSARNVREQMRKQLPFHQRRIIDRARGRIGGLRFRITAAQKIEPLLEPARAMVRRYVHADNLPEVEYKGQQCLPAQFAFITAWRRRRAA